MNEIEGAVSRATLFKLDDAASYDEVTEDFERFTERFSLPLAERMVGLIADPAPANILDVGCGTGVVTRLAARRFPSARVTGIDLSNGMLRSAAELCRYEGIADRVRLVHQDAERLEFPDGAFDCVLSLFALRHFPDPLRALREMRRVVRPGAPVVVGVGSAPPLVSRAAASASLRRMRELLQGLTGRAPLVATGFLDGLLDRYLGAAGPDQEAEWTHGTKAYSTSVARMARDAGFTDVRTTWVGQSSEVASVDEFWRLQATFSSRARKRIPRATPDQLAALRQAFDAACGRHVARGGKLVYRSGALLALATAPRT